MWPGSMTRFARRPGRNAGFVHRLLALLERAGWAGAPRFRGMDEQGREILSFVPGHVPWQPAEQARARSADSLAMAAELVRQFHDLTAGTSLAGGCEVVCHNDLSPGNTVYRDRAGELRPVAFIDWDIAAPGRGSTTSRTCAGSTPGSARRLRTPRRPAGRSGSSATPTGSPTARPSSIRSCSGRTAAGAASRPGAAAGDPAMTRMHASGAAREVRQQHDWVARHRTELQAAVG